MTALTLNSSHLTVRDASIEMQLNASIQINLTFYEQQQLHSNVNRFGASRRFLLKYAFIAKMLEKSKQKNTSQQNIQITFALLFFDCFYVVFTHIFILKQMLIANSAQDQFQVL